MRSELIECVLDLVAEIPPGQASSYGRIAVEARLRCGVGSARQVIVVTSPSWGSTTRPRP